ncbi:MAG TPA: hypothetical protein VMR77_00080 [Patescibacteria group bacterium]|jgi:hypothetical protein|nr:hypothetical protein [Patescibacteria group bacterium]
MEEVATQNQPSQPQKPNDVRLPKWLVITSVLMLVMILAAVILLVGIMLGKSQSPISKTVSLATPTPVVTLAPTVAPTKTVPQFPAITNPNLKRFISEDLGVTFTYLIDQNGQKISAQEIGNKVYVYFSNTQATEGQYLMIMDKDKNQTLEQAIRTQILKGYSESDCLIQPETQYIPVGFTALAIVVPINQNDTSDQIQAKVQKCPATYTAMGGMAYFIEDPSHPDKMIFLSIGQYLINSEGDNVGWQNTLQLF